MFGGIKLLYCDVQFLCHFLFILSRNPGIKSSCKMSIETRKCTRFSILVIFCFQFSGKFSIYFQKKYFAWQEKNHNKILPGLTHQQNIQSLYKKHKVLLVQVMVFYFFFLETLRNFAWLNLKVPFLEHLCTDVFHTTLSQEKRP